MINKNQNKPLDSELTEALKKAAAKIELAQNAKVRVKNRLFYHIKQTSSSVQDQTNIRFFNMNIFRKFSKPIAVTAMVAILALTSVVGVAKAADNSRPGDALFGLDKLLEEVQIFLAANSEAKLRLKIAVAKERLQELQELTDELDETAEISDNTGQGTATTTDDTLPGDNATSTDDTLPDDNATSTDGTLPGDTPTSTPITTDDMGDDSATGNSLLDAINQALAEVDGAIAQVKHDSAKLTLKADNGDQISPDQIAAFLTAASNLVAQEELLIKKLDLKVSGKKIKLKIKIFKLDDEEENSSTSSGQVKDDGDEDSDDNNHNPTATTTDDMLPDDNATSTDDVIDDDDGDGIEIELEFEADDNKNDDEEDSHNDKGKKDKDDKKEKERMDKDKKDKGKNEHKNDKKKEKHEDKEEHDKEED